MFCQCVASVEAGLALEGVSPRCARFAGDQRAVGGGMMLCCGPRAMAPLEIRHSPLGLITSSFDHQSNKQLKSEYLTRADV